MSRSRTIAPLVVALVLLVGSQMAPSAEAALAADPREERDRIRDEQAANAARLDALQADDADVRESLAALADDVAAQEAAVEDAQRAVAAAEEDLRNARAEEARTLGEIEGIEAQQQSLAVDSYMRSGTNQDPLEVLTQTDPTDMAERQALVDLAGSRNADVADQLSAAHEDLAAQRARAEEAKVRAREHQTDAADELEQLRRSQERQAAFAAAVEQRIEAALAESAALEQLDQQIANEIAQQSATLAALAAAAAPPTTTAPPTPPSGGGTAPLPVSGGPISLSTVGGITVASSIAGQVGALLDAARSAGLSLAGGGYRDPAQQIALRQANCPDPVNSPASACSPPTARPGTSMHEQGLAIDFTSSGSLITSRSSSAFQWLSANAGRFGLYNLPSEPWHWSVNGN